MDSSETEKKNEIRISIERKRRPASFSMQTDHSHNYYELYYLRSGKCRVFLNHTIYHLEAGSLILIEPSALHHTIYGITQESERIALFFSEVFMKKMTKQCGTAFRDALAANPCINVDTGRRDYMETLFGKLRAEQENRDEFSEMLKVQSLMELLAFVGRNERKNRQSRMADLADAAGQEQAIQDAARYIYHHFGESITLPQIAERVHMTPTYFSRKFKKLTGFGYKEYLNYVRMKEAQRLLIESSLTISEIACRCGFSDGNYFGDLFRREKGISPGMYRKNPQIL